MNQPIAIIDARSWPGMDCVSAGLWERFLSAGTNLITFMTITAVTIAVHASTWTHEDGAASGLAVSSAAVMVFLIFILAPGTPPPTSRRAVSSLTALLGG